LANDLQWKRWDALAFDARLQAGNGAQPAHVAGFNIEHCGPYRARTDDIHGVNVALYQLS
jgi:hypothetical protein